MTVERVRRLVRAADPVADPDVLHRLIAPTSADLLDGELGTTGRPSTKPRPQMTSLSRPGLLFGGALALVLVWTGLMMALGTAEPPQPAPLAGESSSAPDVVYTEPRSCVSTVSRLVAPGPTTFTVHNESPSLANFELVRLEAEYPAVVAMLRELSVTGWEAFGDPSFIEEVGDRIQLGSGDSGELAAVLTPGTYTVLCIRLNDPVDQDMVEFLPAGLIVVGE